MQPRALAIFALAVVAGCRLEYDPKDEEPRARRAQLTPAPKAPASPAAPATPEPLSVATEADFEQQVAQLITAKNLEAELVRLEQEVGK